MRYFRYHGEKAVTRMERWKKDARKEVVITDLEALVPQDHLLRKIGKVMNCDWLYERDGAVLPP